MGRIHLAGGLDRHQDRRHRRAGAFVGGLPDLCRAQGHRRHAPSARAQRRRPVRAVAADRRRVEAVRQETVIPSGANRGVFIAAPCVTFILALIAWAVIPFGDGLVLANINVGILYLFAVSSLGVYGVLMAGWASNSRYAFLGALRSAAQMVSYEISMGFIIITVLLVAGSLNLSDIVRAQKDVWFVVPLFPMAVIFFISTLAETNRHPFDLPEAEAELVAAHAFPDHYLYGEDEAAALIEAAEAAGCRARDHGQGRRAPAGGHAEPGVGVRRARAVAGRGSASAVALAACREGGRKRSRER